MLRLHRSLAVLLTGAAALLSVCAAGLFLYHALSGAQSSTAVSACWAGSLAPVHQSPTVSPLLRSPVSHHHYALLLDKLHRGEPVRVAILGGSISARDGWHMRRRPDMRYPITFIAWLNSAFPVSAAYERALTSARSNSSSDARALHDRLTHFDALFPQDDAQRSASPYSHKLLNVAAGGTGTQSTSFCWTTLFTHPETGRLALPDLILIDYAVNDAFIGLPGAIVQGEGGEDSSVPTLPLSPLHSLDRLVRFVLLTSAVESQAVALLPLYFKAGWRKQHGSTQTGHDRVARHYGLRAVSFRDHLLHPLTRRPFTTQPPLEEYDRIYEDDSYHPGPEGHRWMTVLLQRTLTSMYDNYFASQRSALVDGWALSGRLASTSARMKDRPGQSSQPSDDVIALMDADIDDSWRVHTDIDVDAVSDWQQRVARGEEADEWILPAILSLPPLPLPPALHPLNQDLPPSFFCRKTYAPYLAEPWRMRYAEAERWMGIVPPSPAPRSLLPALARHDNVSADLQLLFSSPPSHQHKFTFAPNPQYLAARAAQPELALPLPSLTVQLPRITHSVSVFYLRTPHEMATAEAFVSCSGQPDVRSASVLLNGTWASPASQATVMCVLSIDGSSPSCYDRLHLQLLEAAEFHFIGFAAA